MKNDEKDSSPSLQDRIGEFSRRHRRWVHVGLVVAILFLGILVHLNDLNHWTDHRDSTFVEGEPILSADLQHPVSFSGNAHIYRADSSRSHAPASCCKEQTRFAPQAVTSSG